MEKRGPAAAQLGLLYCAAIWGSTFVLVKDTLAEVDAVVLVAYRFGLAALLLALPVVWQREKLFKGFKDGLILGLVLFLLYVPQTIGLNATTATNSAFITGLFVAFTPLLAPFFKRRPGWNEWLAVAVSLAGLLLLTGGTTRLNWGDLITLLAALTYALHVLLTDRLADDTINPFRLIFQQFLVIFLCSLMMALIFDLPLGVGSMNAWWVVIFLAIFPTASGFVIQLWGQRVVPPTRTALIFALEPVFAAMFAWTVGGEVVTVNKTLGGLLIVGAMMISTAPPRFKRE